MHSVWHIIVDIGNIFGISTTSVPCSDFKEILISGAVSLIDFNL